MNVYRELRQVADSIAEEAGTGPFAAMKASMALAEKATQLEKLIDRAEKESNALGLRWTPEEDYFAGKVQSEIPTLSHERNLDVQARPGQVNHALLLGDNLLGLIALLPAYKGCVKAIIIDPPYKSDSDEMTFRDNYSHSFWLTLMCVRLIIAKKLARRDGIVHIHIDEREMAHLKLLMTALFTEDAYIATQIWKKKAGGGNDTGAIVADHEYILSSGVSAIEKPLMFLDPLAEVSTSYTEQDENGKYALERLDKPSLPYLKSLDFTIVAPDGTRYDPAPRSDGTKVRWRWSESTVVADMDQLVFKNGSVYTKNYEKDAHKPRTLLTEDRFGRTRTGKGDLKRILGAGKFSYPKPVELVKHLIRISTREDDIIVDFFAGSGTTAQATAELNLEDGGRRKAILITDAGLASESGPSAAVTAKQKAKAINIGEDITHERLRRVLTGEDWADGKSHPNLEQGLQVFRLGTTPTVKREVLGYSENGAILSTEFEKMPFSDIAESLSSSIESLAMLRYRAAVAVDAPAYLLLGAESGAAVVLPRDHYELDDDSSALIADIRALDTETVYIVTPTAAMTYEWMSGLPWTCAVDPLGDKMVNEWHAAKETIRSKA